ncbi:MAG: hypothetical protein QNJ12_01815 [Ilumatobacter sp.]|uniref:hypothetical protein n=1 Tax=Ilumatobacter sp. TaxID=1967498 RepID=UPI00261AEBF7|nr:hypothetical protein [Ilumatobacter sp.]MDJ0767491.1 hypothetical protein [Ilumatobacter sp.]
MDTRRISPNELEVMQAWLAHDVADAAVLRTQLTAETEVYRSCSCGCGSIGFVNIDESLDPGVSIFDVDAEIVDENGATVGGMTLLIRNGRLHDVDVHTWLDPLPFPTVEEVRWHPRTGRDD